ncbi:hypothetical protein BGX31_010380 [Mortierella sp. GBA43]|nr:hypothetical protein BGX31_010380 [Mortierella sp. GBA43]
MLFGGGGIVSSPLGTFSPQQALELANIYLENALKAKDPYIALVLCHNTEISLSQARKASKGVEVRAVREGIATGYTELGKQLDKRGRHREAQASFKRATKLVDRLQENRRKHVLGQHQDLNERRPDNVPEEQVSQYQESRHEKDQEQLSLHTQALDPDTIESPIETSLGSMVSIHGLNIQSLKPVPYPAVSMQKQHHDVAKIPQTIFPKNTRPLTNQLKLPEADERLSNTQQLACCLGLLRNSQQLDDILDPAARKWLQSIQNDTDEQDRLKVLATDVIKAFQRNELKDDKAVAEVVRLAPVLEKSDFQYLLKELCKEADQSPLLDIHQLEGIARLIRGADPSYLDADDLVKILELLSTRLRGTHNQSSIHAYQLTTAVSSVLDAMADIKVEGIDRVNLYEPLLSYLSDVKDSPDPYLVFQAAYAYQALLHVPDDETLWQASLRRTGKVIEGLPMSTVKNQDLGRFMDGLKDLQQGVAGASSVFKAEKITYDGVPTIVTSDPSFLGSSVFRAVKTTYDGAPTAMTSDPSFSEGLKEGLGVNRKLAWYPALRGAEALLVEGQLTAFKKLICEAPCRRDSAFLWGVCQRLGEVAADPKWDTKTRQGAVAFLGEIYRDDTEWGTQASVKEWIITLLMKLSSLAENDVEGALYLYINQSVGTSIELMLYKMRTNVMFNSIFVYLEHTAEAETLLQDLEMNADDDKAILFKTCRAKDAESYPLKTAPPPPVSPALVSPSPVSPTSGSPSPRSRSIRSPSVVSRPPVSPSLVSPPALVSPSLTSPPIVSPPLESLSLLDRVQQKPSIEGQLLQLRKQRLSEYPKSVYIPPQAKPGLQASDNSRSNLTDAIKEFLENDLKVFLLLGDSGAGKSTFNKALEYDLWEGYKKQTGAIPLFIDLPTIDKPEDDMIAKELRKADFTESQIKELKVNRRFILICDGYDESQQSHNLYTTNRLNQPGEWKAKMVISCRTEYLGTDYRDQFRPEGPDQSSESVQFQEAVITPFSVDQVESYIDEYVSIHQPLWEAKNYREALRQIPGLQDLVRNPFLMSLSLEVLPRMMGLGRQFSATRVTKVALYDQFVIHWLERGKKRLGEKDLNPQARVAFENLIDEGFAASGAEFLKRLAVAIYKEQYGQPIVQYSRYKDDGTWKAEFFGRDEEKQLLREACPLTKNGNQYRFLHQSLLEYGLTLAIFDPQDWRGIGSVLVRARRGSTSSVMSFETSRATGNVARPADRADPNSPLVWKNIVNEPSLMKFLEERVQEQPVFKQRLLDYIELSKSDEKWRTAAANAITILVRTGAQFGFADLRGIRIPGADITSGVFESAQLQGADLRKVNLRDSWLQKANLSGAQMSGAHFGELQPLEHNGGSVESYMYSPDGSSLVVGLSSGDVIMYKTSNREKSWTSKGHTEKVRSVVFSPTGDRIISGSEDKTLRLWDSKTGACHHVLTGHTDWIQSIAYSPRGDLVASGSRDKAVRLWDLGTGHCRHTLTGHTDIITSVEFSPDGSQVASGSKDSTVFLWDVETGLSKHTLSGHSMAVTHVSFSSQGNQLVSASNDETLRVWDVETGESRHELTGHTKEVSSVAFSPNGSQIASGSHDSTVRVWDLESGECRHILSGHTGPVNSVVYSLQGDQLMSASDDNTIKLWDPETGDMHHTPTVHGRGEIRVLLSPRGEHLVFCNRDSSVQLWDERAETSRTISNRHLKSVTGVKVSQDGYQVASFSEDDTIRLWDARTGAYRHTLAVDLLVNDVAYSPQGGQAVSGCGDNSVRLWDVVNGTCRHVLNGHTGGVYNVTYSPQGRQIASISRDDTIRLWDAESGACRHVLSGHYGRIYAVAFSPRGHQLSSASGDSSVRLWDVESGECLHSLNGHTGDVTSVVYSPNGSQIASSSNDFTVRLWDVETGVCSHILTGHRHYVWKVVYSPDGKQIASVSQDKTVLLWDVDTGRCRRTFKGHQRGVDMISFSPRADMIASGSTGALEQNRDEDIRLWDVAAGQCIHVFKPAARTFAWRTDSDLNHLVTGGYDGAVRMWQITKGADGYSVRMLWRSTFGKPSVKDACIQNVQGLSSLNRLLLQQHGAVEVPDRRHVRLMVGLTSLVTFLCVTMWLDGSRRRIQMMRSPSL